MLLYNQAIGLSAELAPDSPRYFVNGNGSAGYFNQGLTRALDAVTPNELAAGIIAADPIGRESGGCRRKDEGRSMPPAGAGATSGSSKPRKDEPFLDMMVLAHPRDLAKARVRSLFAEAVTAAPAKAA